MPSIISKKEAIEKSSKETQEWVDKTSNFINEEIDEKKIVKAGKIRVEIEVFSGPGSSGVPQYVLNGIEIIKKKLEAGEWTVNVRKHSEQMDGTSVRLILT